MGVYKFRYRAERPKIQDQFADLKRELAGVPESAWDAIPDVGDHTLKLKQKKKAEQYTPMTDALLQVDPQIRYMCPKETECNNSKKEQLSHRPSLFST